MVLRFFNIALIQYISYYAKLLSGPRFTLIQSNSKVGELYSYYSPLFHTFVIALKIAPPNMLIAQHRSFVYEKMKFQSVPVLIGDVRWWWQQRDRCVFHSCLPLVFIDTLRDDSLQREINLN